MYAWRIAWLYDAKTKICENILVKTSSDEKKSLFKFVIQ